MPIHIIQKYKHSKIFLSFIILFSYGCSNKTTIDGTFTEDALDKKSDSILMVPLAPLDQWTERKFLGESEFRITKNTGGESEALQISSNKSASLLYKKFFVDLNQTPYINWQWLIANTYPENNQEKEKSGDDFPARIYIAVKPELGQIKPRALTYVWASNEKKQTYWDNPFNKTVGVFVIESGAQSSGNWLSEKQNLKADLSKYFGQPIESIEGIGIMSDSDNTQSQSEASFRNLFFSKN